MTVIEALQRCALFREFTETGIRLRSGQTFRSPTRHDENGARALRAEIIRRLNVPPDAQSNSI